MRHWILALLLTLPALPLAQESQEALVRPERPEAPARRPTAAPPLPAPDGKAAPEARQGPPVDEELQEKLRSEARYLLLYLLTGDVRGALPMMAFPFQLEDRKLGTPEELVAVWAKQLRRKRTDLVTLHDVEVLPYEELEAKYGKPPARLGAIAPPRTEIYAAVANLSGRGAVLLYRQVEGDWRAFAYTD